MSYFSTPALAANEEFAVSLDGVWSQMTFDWTWASPTDPGRAFSIYASVDEGNSWVSFAAVVAGQNPFLHVTDKPINAVKIAAGNLGSGNAVTVRFTGT